MSNIISRVGFWAFWLRLPDFWDQLLVGSILLKFILGTRLALVSSEPLIGFPAFLVQKLSPKSNKLKQQTNKLSNWGINTLASGWFWRFLQKNSSFQLPYQRPSSSADCARELFNGSNGTASLVDCTRKKIFAWGCGFFVTDDTSEVVLGSFWLMLPGLGQSVSLKFSLETRLVSESFEPLIDFLAFLVQKL